MKKNLLYAILATTCLTIATPARASTIETPTQYCQPGNVLIPSNKICAATLDTTVNGIAVPLNLNATTYDPETDRVEYNLLEPILLTIPGPDGDRVELNEVSIFLDPVLKFDVSIQDSGNPSPFDVTFTSFPFAPNVSIESSISGVLTDGSVPKDGVNLTTPQLLTYEFLDATGNPVDFFAYGSQVSFPAGVPNGSQDSHLYEPLSRNGRLGCNSVGCGRVKLSLAFTGSGGGDRYEFTSRSDVTALEKVPEPSATVPLAFFGLAGLLAIRERLS